ncbi:amidohydrolase 2 [Rhodopseudomonas palustris BisB18]|uniref:Amidohydrolase 2 n=2 Tax=Rhodopseudomonas palustris TaxID=1076 RepID=Q214B4_RHOPB
MLAGCLGILPSLSLGRSSAAEVVRASAGTDGPVAKAPHGATDCHFHTYDRRYPAAGGASLLPADALPDDYRGLQRRLGTSRGVIVQPSTYGTDNSLQLASMEALGRDRFRMVAVVAEDVPNAELKRLDGLGVRGVRFNLSLPGPLTVSSLKVLAPRLAALGWHCQINMTPKQMEDEQALLSELPGQLVFDHFGQIPQPAGTGSQSYAIIRRLLDRGNTWVKLSGAYLRSIDGAPGYADSGRIAAAFVAAAPQRIVWGSDWPHPTKSNDAKPDDAVLFDRLADWAGSPEMFSRILVDNPAVLYGFPPLS